MATPANATPVNFNEHAQCSRCNQFTNRTQWCIGVLNDPQQMTGCLFVGGEHLHLTCNNCGYGNDVMWTAANPRGH